MAKMPKYIKLEVVDAVRLQGFEERLAALEKAVNRIADRMDIDSVRRHYITFHGTGEPGTRTHRLPITYRGLEDS